MTGVQTCALPICGLISFNGFTSTTRDYEVALTFADSRSTHESVIFQILANYNLENVIFADITQYSDFHEDEILFGLCSVFKITNCYRNENRRVSIIEITATDDDAENFQNYVQKEIEVMVIGNRNHLLLRCSNRCSRYRNFILASVITCILVASITMAILSYYIPSKHLLSGSYNCDGANCTTVATNTGNTESYSYDVILTDSPWRVTVCLSRCLHGRIVILHVFILIQISEHHCC